MNEANVADVAEMFTRSLGLLLCTISMLGPLDSGYSRQRVLEDDNLRYGRMVIDWNFHVTGSERYQSRYQYVRLRTQGAHNLNCTVDKNSRVEYMRPRRTYPD
jgi:hypothetical protein